MARQASLPVFTRHADDDIIIRRAESLADYRACQDVQRGAWGIVDEGYVVPIATLVGANLHGGMVLGAFQPDGQAVGFSFGFLGRIEGCLCLYSQLTGVLPAFQSRGLGQELKFAQRDLARAEGLGKIAWAFDPLQAGNAFFNLQRLGAYARRYIDNMYGPRTDALNAIPGHITDPPLTVARAGVQPGSTAEFLSLRRAGKKFGWTHLLGRG